MLILASTSDKIRLVTGSAGSVFVHASWLDNISGAIAPGRTNTPNITAAATTDIVGSPAAGVFRAVKTMHINNQGTTTQTVTVIHTDGTNAVELHRQTLGPHETLQYIDEIGFRYINSVGEDGNASRVLLATVVPAAGAANFIVGPEVWANPNYAAIEITHLCQVQVGYPDDSVGFRISNDGGATYYGDLGQNGYGLAYHYGGPSTFSGGNFVISYGWLGTPAQSAALPGAFPSTGRWILYGSNSSNVKTWLVQSGGYSGGGWVSNGWGWSGLPAITHMKFFWVAGGRFDGNGFFKFYGMK